LGFLPGPFVGKGVEHSEWIVVELPIFTQRREWLMGRIPVIEPYVASV